MPLESLFNPESRLSIRDLSLETPEKEWNPERELHLREQYERQVNILRQAGLLERLSTGQDGLRGIDKREYPLPSYEDVAASLREQHELVETKANQGFTRLLIVPFGRKLADLVQTYGDRLKAHYVDMPDPQNPANRVPDPSRTKLFRARRNSSDPLEPTHLDTAGPVYEWTTWSGTDESGELLYNLKQHPPTDKQGNRVYDAQRDGGVTKQQELAATGGWQVLLVEERPDISRESNGQALAGRPQIVAGDTPEEYLELFQAASRDPRHFYHGESGLTPEAWLTLALANLEEKNEVTDDYDGRGSINYNVGSYLKSSGYVPNSYWDRDDSRVRLGGYNPGYSGVDVGVRPSVRIPLIPLELRSSSSLQPLSSPSLPETRKF